ncbi:MAG: hypothetical protein JWR21_4362 [Herminiimonas sp.]|nr:hypothetical protein [Herminiimonas sp.]
MTALTAHRSVIFISHATPEDNEFAKWLAARLQAEGYNAWVELNELEVGGKFWPRIEHCIRQEAIRFICVVSHRAANKSGFRRELSMADSIERALQGFILPVRIDNYSYDDLPAQVHDKHVEDFSAGWHMGLAKLLKKLEKDAVPRTPPSTDSLHSWVSTLLPDTDEVIEQEETIHSNWLTSDGLTCGICLHQFHGDPLTEGALQQDWACRLVGNTFITFARPNEFSFFKYYSGKVTTNEVLPDAFTKEAFPQLPMLSQKDRRSILTDLIRQAWELAMRKRKLHAYELANKKLYWYLPWNLSQGKRLFFTAAAGRSGRRALNGESGKLNMHWHFAVRPWVKFVPAPRIALIYTVVFTEDGTTPLEDKKRAHRLRMSFCKSWWQDRWRDMLAAYLHYLRGESPALKIELSSDKNLFFSANFDTFVCPVSAPEPNGVEDVADELVDKLSGDEVVEGNVINEYDTLISTDAENAEE